MSGTSVLGDWGTSRLRLYRVREGEVVETFVDPDEGALKSDAADVLAQKLAAWDDAEPIEDVTICGMAGARGALVEAGYGPCPADIETWRRASSEVAVGRWAVKVMAGLACRTARGTGDVMRGEETQVFGAVALDPELGRGERLIVLPGTHAKWVWLADGRIERFRTCPTGELYSLLARQSTLPGAADSAGAGSFDEGFAHGLERSEEPLAASLFEARSARLLDDRSRDWSTGYLSGLLIGNEASTMLAGVRNCLLIGESALVDLYGRALSALGCMAVAIDGTAAVIAGLKLAGGTPA
ncbi:2-dehydro-3-deoxygalactonokinase [Novosphingobium sp. ZN18A2]|uniref:2-dehydro-3-deoxygalactonokinase n=1 Tax=Novosphingobium sp. ZN18A2 TaxID=3079861 RepID=UPI0030D09F88